MRGLPVRVGIDSTDCSRNAPMRLVRAAAGHGRLEVSAYIATAVNGREYVVLIDNQVVAGPFATAAEAVKARDALEVSLPEAEGIIITMLHGKWTLFTPSTFQVIRRREESMYMASKEACHAISRHQETGRYLNVLRL